MATCHFCTSEYKRGVNAPHWTGDRYERVNVCGADACRARITTAPKAPRRPRQPVSAGDVAGWSAMAQWANATRKGGQR